MLINKNNYEPFFIDYYDGNLSAQQVKELFLFLETHPELKAEFESFSNITLDAPEMEFPNRDALKRGIITASNIEQYLVASLEGDLSEAEEKELKIFLEKNPKFNHDVALYPKTISTPDLSIVYPDKKSLKQPIPFYVAYRNEIRLGIAAILLLSIIAGTVAIFNRTMVQTQKQVAGQLPTPSTIQKSGTDSVSPKISIPSTSNITPVQIQAPVAERKNQPRKQQKQLPVQPEPNDISTPEAEPLQLANALPSGQLQPGETPMQVVAHPASGDLVATKGETNEEYMSVWEALRQTSEKNLRKAVGKEEEVLAYADENENSRLRLIDVVSKGVEKISNDKAKLETHYDNDKQSNAFSFSLGKFSIEKK